MTNPIEGKTLRWTYEDGPMRGKRFEHRFGKNSRVSWRTLSEASKQDDAPSAESAETAKYEIAQINDDVCVVSYLAPSGWTLTSVLDFESGTVVSLASNDAQLAVQHGRFEEVRQAA